MAAVAGSGVGCPYLAPPAGLTDTQTGHQGTPSQGADGILTGKVRRHMADTPSWLIQLQLHHMESNKSDTVGPLYNPNIFSKILTKTLRRSSVRARYGVFFVSSFFSLNHFPVFVIVTLHAMSCYKIPCYKEVPLHIILGNMFYLVPLFL